MSLHKSLMEISVVPGHALLVTCMPGVTKVLPDGRCRLFQDDLGIAR